MPDPTKAGLERDRICTALVAVVGEYGYPATTLELVLGRASVDHATFAKHFSSFDACFEEVWKGLAQEFVGRSLAAYAAADNWRDGMRAQAWELCRFLQEDHTRARICMVETTYATEMIRANRDELHRAYADLIHLGRTEREEAFQIPYAQAEGVMGALWERATKTVARGAFEDLPKQVPEMMYIVVLPYLGLEAAKEELRRGPGDIARYERGEL
jgi:AcrR family transcriptional regulator